MTKWDDYYKVGFYIRLFKIFNLYTLKTLFCKKSSLVYQNFILNER